MSVVFQEGVLSDIARVTMGQSPKKEFVSSTQEGLPLLNGPTEFGSSHPTPVQWSTSFSKTAEPGDILFCVRGSTTGRMNWADQQYAIGRGIASISAINPQERHFVRAAIDLVLPELLAAATGSTFPNVSRLQLSELPVALPSAAVRTEISGLLGALDDKIESNLRVRNLCRDLGGNLVADTVRSAPSTQLEHYAASISRGVTPRYYKDEDASPVLVLNQKCIRDGWVTPELARLMIPRSREKSQAIARLDDLLVNSTGQGTLGRVARWDSDDPIYVDSHVTVVKADPRRIYPVLMPYLVFPLQDEIEHMATGSTGQTELSPSRLAQLNVPLLSLEEQRPLSARLVALEAQAHYCQVQSLKLTELRDALLPELMSGRMRVDEAGRLVSEALDEEVADV
ncbi:restriction endonuclease subunit S [Schaalia odontolytica]|uniref:restriction endonuclease subunit S n=1 Tax=Schaalia odontolytica TaxID=1660 RepID=UPI001D05C322|nr:restriction endonuclease subunit S [Schaalia odontolytica]MCB6403061.1 restriction endonuclease subunit S [Schaalia odontolytica]